METIPFLGSGFTDGQYDRATSYLFKMVGRSIASRKDRIASTCQPLRYQRQAAPEAPSKAVLEEVRIDKSEVSLDGLHAKHTADDTANTYPNLPDPSQPTVHRT